MNPLFAGLFRMGARKLAQNPELRAKSARAARAAIDEARKIARDDDRPRAAGRAVRRALDRFRGAG